MSLEQSDAQAAAVSTKPRVTLQDIKDYITYKRFVSAEYACGHDGPAALKTYTLCICVLKNGYVVVGTSAPASPENFDLEVGNDIAFQDVVRQVWPLMGFQLKTMLAQQGETSSQTKLFP